MPNPAKNCPKQARGYPLEGPERSKTAEGHPGALQETRLRRLERHLGVQEVTLREDFEAKMKIYCGNADFLKSMLSPRREHRFWGPEGPKMEPRTHLERPCEAKRAEAERKSD